MSTTMIPAKFLIVKNFLDFLESKIETKELGIKEIFEEFMTLEDKVETPKVMDVDDIISSLPTEILLMVKDSFFNRIEFSAKEKVTFSLISKERRYTHVSEDYMEIKNILDIFKRTKSIHQQDVKFVEFKLRRIHNNDLNTFKGNPDDKEEYNNFCFNLTNNLGYHMLCEIDELMTAHNICFIQ